MIYKIISISLICHLSLLLQGQHQTDSLLNLLKNENKDTAIAKLYIEIGDQLEYTDQDSAIYYYQKSINYIDDQIKNNPSSIIE